MSDSYASFSESFDPDEYWRNKPLEDHTKCVLYSIGDERGKQRKKWGNSHDDEHTDGAIARAGAVYALMAAGINMDGLGPWPWPWSQPPKQYDKRRALIVAAAMLVAEAERMDREAARVAPCCAKELTRRFLDLPFYRQHEAALGLGLLYPEYQGQDINKDDCRMVIFKRARERGLVDQLAEAVEAQHKIMKRGEITVDIPRRRTEYPT